MPVAAELFRDVPVRESELRQDRDCHVRAQLVQRVLQTAAKRPEVQHCTASNLRICDQYKALEDGVSQGVMHYRPMRMLFSSKAGTELHLMLRLLGPHRRCMPIAAVQFICGATLRAFCATLLRVR